eukprot:gene7011-4973_t
MCGLLWTNKKAELNSISIDYYYYYYYCVPTMQSSKLADHESNKQTKVEKKKKWRRRGLFLSKPAGRREGPSPLTMRRLHQRQRRMKALLAGALEDTGAKDECSDEDIHATSSTLSSFLLDLGEEIRGDSSTRFGYLLGKALLDQCVWQLLGRVQAAVAEKTATASNALSTPHGMSPRCSREGRRSPSHVNPPSNFPQQEGQQQQQHGASPTLRAGNMLERSLCIGCVLEAWLVHLQRLPEYLLPKWESVTAALHAIPHDVLHEKSPQNLPRCVTGPARRTENTSPPLPSSPVRERKRNGGMAYEPTPRDAVRASPSFLSSLPYSAEALLPVLAYGFAAPPAVAKSNSGMFGILLRRSPPAAPLPPATPATTIPSAPPPMGIHSSQEEKNQKSTEIASPLQGSAGSAAPIHEDHPSGQPSGGSTTTTFLAVAEGIALMWLEACRAAASPLQPPPATSGGGGGGGEQETWGNATVGASRVIGIHLEEHLIDLLASVLTMNLLRYPQLRSSLAGSENDDSAALWEELLCIRSIHPSARAPSPPMECGTPAPCTAAEEKAWSDDFTMVPDICQWLFAPHFTTVDGIATQSRHFSLAYDQLGSWEAFLGTPKVLYAADVDPHDAQKEWSSGAVFPPLPPAVVTSVLESTTVHMALLALLTHRIFPLVVPVVVRSAALSMALRLGPLLLPVEEPNTNSRSLSSSPTHRDEARSECLADTAGEEDADDSDGMDVLTEGFESLQRNYHEMVLQPQRRACRQPPLTHHQQPPPQQQQPQQAPYRRSWGEESSTSCRRHATVCCPGRKRSREEEEEEKDRPSTGCALPVSPSFPPPRPLTGGGIWLEAELLPPPATHISHTAPPRLGCMLQCQQDHAVHRFLQALAGRGSHCSAPPAEVGECRKTQACTGRFDTAAETQLRLLCGALWCDLCSGPPESGAPRGGTRVRDDGTGTTVCALSDDGDKEAERPSIEWLRLCPRDNWKDGITLAHPSSPGDGKPASAARGPTSAVAAGLLPPPTTRSTRVHSVHHRFQDVIPIAPVPAPAATTVAATMDESDPRQARLRLTGTPTCGANDLSSSASTPDLEAWEEVGEVLHSISETFHSRTLVDDGAWRYGRNRSCVAGVSYICTARPPGVDVVHHRNEETKDITKKGEGCGAEEGDAEPRVGAAPSHAAPPCLLDDDAPLVEEEVDLHGLFFHEDEVLCTSAGEAYALETQDDWLLLHIVFILHTKKDAPFYRTVTIPIPIISFGVKYEKQIKDWIIRSYYYYYYSGSIAMSLTWFLLALNEHAYGVNFDLAETVSYDVSLDNASARVFSLVDKQTRKEWIAQKIFTEYQVALFEGSASDNARDILKQNKRIIFPTYVFLKERHFLFTPAYEKTMRDVMKGLKNVEDRICFARRTVVQLFDILHSFKKAGVTLRTITPENLYVVGTFPHTDIRFWNFERVLLDCVDTTKCGGGTTVDGARAYQPPEASEGNVAPDHLWDIWAGGVVLAEILTGKHPFIGEKGRVELKKMKMGGMSTVSNEPELLQPYLKRIYTTMVTDREQRWHAGQLQEEAHCFFDRAEDRTAPFIIITIVYILKSGNLAHFFFYGKPKHQSRSDPRDVPLISNAALAF